MTRLTRLALHLSTAIRHTPYVALALCSFAFLANPLAHWVVGQAQEQAQ